MMDQAETQTILIVDDDPTLRMVAAAHLRQQGYAVATAENGSVLLDILQDINPDLIMLDVDMPLLNGFAACRQLRKIELGRTIPVLMMTGLEGDNSIEEAYSAGATDFIAKPVNWTLLKQRLRFMLRAVHAMSDLVKSEARLAKAQSIAGLDYWRWDLIQEKIIVSAQLAERLHLDVNKIVSEQMVTAIADIENSRGMLKRPCSAKSYTIPTDFEISVGGNKATESQVFRIQSELQYASDNTLVSIEGTLQDITVRKETEDRILFLSTFDRLTGLQNRESFTSAVSGMIDENVKEDSNTVLVLIDIDRFVRINDIFGHRTGDAVLVEVSRRIVRFLHSLEQKTDEVSSQACRWGGDKFSAAISCSSASPCPQVIITDLLKCISAPFKVNGHEVALTSSIGYALTSDSGLDLEVLIRNAENATRNAKRQGRNITRCYDASMHESTERHMMLESELYKALSKKQFTLHYQPRINAIDKKIVGAEALIRWHHPIIGDVSPVEFIPVLEEIGLIHEVGAWVMEVACQQLKIWNDKGYTDFVMSVNLSAVQFRDTRLAQEIDEVIKRIGINPQRLEVELTETAIMEDVGQTQATLAVLKKIGLRISVDDFGTGYSSLAYLRSFPLDTLKIDRTFVTELPGNSEDRSLTSAIIAMARSLKLHIVAEGVENEAQAAFLLEKHCDEFQGFLYSRPINQKAFTALLTQSA
ncbi:putative bifunctional diguanylate cyclase/phosphodiesterase [Neptunomonas antarctica]|uniref:cyclic-guanylate-specific phosphodiesterase n=1 Tax=Neptunomonas antarctica TaxID=619304 RepID=A0A1N7NLU0_9GAMM|nr:EAL domain-containing response regulator [Neptunomonas antarctica]SIS99336.1 response regulator receiver modulated diguanylate cyclase/phosphodiesterase [Neptunomonas antarctica]